MEVMIPSKEYLKLKRKIKYGQIWITETVFSPLKKMFGEYFYSVKMKNIKQGLMLKASLYKRSISLDK